MVENKAGIIDPYDPSIHQDAGRRIEPRLVSLSPEIATQRRKLIGIIPYEGLDWVFVNVDDLAQEVDPLGEPTTLIQENYDDLLEVGTYSRNNGIYLVRSSNRHFFIGCSPESARRGIVVEPSIGTALNSRGFRYEPTSNPFGSSDGAYVQIALLNAIAPGLGADYFPFNPYAEQIKFYVDDIYGYYKEVVATRVPPSPTSPLLDFPPSRR